MKKIFLITGLVIGLILLAVFFFLGWLFIVTAAKAKDRGNGPLVTGIVGFLFLVFCYWLIPVIRKKLNAATDVKAMKHINQDLRDDKAKVIEIFNKIKSFAKNKLEEKRFKNTEQAFRDNTVSKIEKLKSIEELRANNVITQEEFELLKKEILNT